jgi:hypothetical protein
MPEKVQDQLDWLVQVLDWQILVQAVVVHGVQQPTADWAELAAAELHL